MVYQNKLSELIYETIIDTYFDDINSCCVEMRIIMTKDAPFNP
jgi:hypothetical protein